MDRNIVLICVDTARKDFFDRYATRIQERADVTFSQARAASCWSLPSHGSMFTGKFPSEHGYHSHNPTYADLEISETFLSELPGYSTVGVSANSYASSDFGFDVLFDSFVDIYRGTLFNNGIRVSEWLEEHDSESLRKYPQFFRAAITHEHPLESISNGIMSQLQSALPNLGIPRPLDDGAKSILRETKREFGSLDEPFFLFANIMDAHAPRHPRLGYDNSLHGLPADWERRFKTWEIHLGDDKSKFNDVYTSLRKLHAAEVDYVDRMVAKYIDYIQANSTRETTFVITADHGENFGYPDEEYLVKHTSSVSEGLLHVPFVIVNAPEGYDELEDGLFSHIRLPELLVGLANNETPDVFDETIAAEVIGICSAHRKNVDEEQIEYWDRMIRCAYRDGTKVEWDSLGSVRWYALDPDTPSSQTEIEREENPPEWALDHFSTDITTYKEQAVAADTRQGIEEGMAESTQRRLADLGYI
ncbi:sulfatase-like hydrolase/transferase [Natronosalvus halobius]|uniref:sulfatase-like hydrolase/transferase n=1 Tax=Natronosalvus halobius TaxID=2953746 RepID=UPI00209D9058|nr:sulfatase-like hydrolase/transferase [Natronosalvus halobius]USZ71453.1 sulfatase-like hydrolase/transferase [Natronosalvus halobius]